MTFLNSLMLLGLAATALPVLIHLFHRQRISTVDFSSIVFIRDHHLQRSRAFRVRELLLLILRTLIILLVVLAFSRPVIQGMAGSFLGSGFKQKTVFAILLDNSYSMDAGNFGETPFDAAKAKALEIINTMQDGDEGFLVLSTNPNDVFPAVAPTNMEMLKNVLMDAEISDRSGDIGRSLSLIREKLGPIGLLSKQIYILSDLQRNDWEVLEEYAPELPFAHSVQYHLCAFESDEIENVSLDAVSVSEGLLIRNQPEQFIATYTNRNSAAIRNQAVSLFINGEKRGVRHISTDPGETGALEFNILIEEPGRYNGYVELNEDDIEADNRRYFTFTVPRAFGVTAIGQAESRFFIEQVLTPSSGLMTPVELRTASSDALNSDFYESNVLIVDGSVELTPARMSSLERYILSGGGVLMFVGNGLTADGYGNSFFEKVFGVSIIGRRGTPGQKLPFLRLGQIDYEHPVFRFANHATDALSTGAVQFYASYILKADLGAQVIARFSDGTPAIVEGRFGHGRALIVASDLNTRWSDLALRSVFVPFMHRNVRYLHPAVGVSEGSFIAGNKLIQPIALTSTVSNLSIEYPSGSTESVSTRVTRQGMTVEISDTNELGVYLLRNNEVVFRSFAVNPDTRESDLDSFSLEQAGRLLGEEVPVVFMDKGSSFMASVEADRTGVSDRYEVWKSLVIMALLLLLIEYWLSGSRTVGSKPASSLEPI